MEDGLILQPERIARVSRYVLGPPLHELLLERRPFVARQRLPFRAAQLPGRFDSLPHQIPQLKDPRDMGRECPSVVDEESAGLAGFGLLLRPLTSREQLHGRGHDRVHHDIPCLTRRRRRESEGPVLQVEVDLVVVLRGVGDVPVLETDPHVIEEPLVRSCDGHPGLPNDADVVEVEDGEV